MQYAVTALRALWLILVVVFFILILEGAIGGFATAAYAAVVLAVGYAELALRRRIRHT